jgi:hypothetical protein
VNSDRAIGKCLCIIFSIPPRPTASSLQPPPHAAKPHPHNNDAASNHPSHNATPFPSSSNEDYNTVNNAHATHTPTNAPNTYESPANDETTHYPNTPPSAHPDALPPALTHPNTAPQPPSDTNPTPPQTLSDAPRPLASPNDLSHSHDPHAHPRAAHRAPCPPPSNYTPKATITQSRFRPKTPPDTPPQLPPFYCRCHRLRSLRTVVWWHPRNCAMRGALQCCAESRTARARRRTFGCVFGLLSSCWSCASSTSPVNGGGAATPSPPAGRVGVGAMFKSLRKDTYQSRGQSL